MLRELQQQFLDDLFSQEEQPPTLRGLSDTGRRQPKDQFGSYRESVIAGIIDALAETYPVCKKLVGERFFNAMATRFIAKYRSHSPDLNEYGQQFAEFIDTFPPAESLPYLADVARLEWVWQSVLDGAEPLPGNLHELGTIVDSDSDDIRFKLYGNCMLLASAYPIYRIWQANQKDAKENEINIDNGSVQLIVWREGKETRVDSLSEEQWRFLTLIQGDMPFGDLCVEMTHQFGEIDLGELLGVAIQRGWITGFELNVPMDEPGKMQAE